MRATLSCSESLGTDYWTMVRYSKQIVSRHFVAVLYVVSLAYIYRCRVSLISLFKPVVATGNLLHRVFFGTPPESCTLTRIDSTVNLVSDASLQHSDEKLQYYLNHILINT